MGDAQDAPTGGVAGTGAGSLPPAVFQAIVDRTAHPFVVIDPDGTIRYAGSSMDCVLDWAPEELVGRNMVDFLTEEGVGQALQVVAEIDVADRSGAGVPMVFELRQPDGSTTWAEIGAIPLFDVGIDAIALRCRPWASQHQLNSFVESLLADDPLSDVLGRLCPSIATSLDAVGAAVHHGYDGTGFAAVTSSGLDAEHLGGPGPWTEVVGGQAVLHTPVDDLPSSVADAARRAGLSACWAAPVRVVGWAGAGRAVGLAGRTRADAHRPWAGHRAVPSPTCGWPSCATPSTSASATWQGTMP